jgi:hypothetical protein
MKSTFVYKNHIEVHLENTGMHPDGTRQDVMNSMMSLWISMELLILLRLPPSLSKLYSALF